MALIFNSVPMGSLVTIPEGKRLFYIENISQLPRMTSAMIYSLNTGAFLRGLAKSYGLPEEKSSIIAFAVVQVAVNEISFTQLPSMLSTKLPLPNDKAQKMAREIEQDLFGPVRQELEAHWATEKKEKPAAQAQAKAEESGVNNVLNLKKESQPPVPPWRNLQNR
jgi:hypothetical protein